MYMYVQATEFFSITKLSYQGWNNYQNIFFDFQVKRQWKTDLIISITQWA